MWVRMWWRGSVKSARLLAPCIAAVQTLRPCLPQQPKRTDQAAPRPTNGTHSQQQCGGRCSGTKVTSLPPRHHHVLTVWSVWSVRWRTDNRQVSFEAGGCAAEGICSSRRLQQCVEWRAARTGAPTHHGWRGHRSLSGRSGYGHQAAERGLGHIVTRISTVAHATTRRRNGNQVKQCITRFKHVNGAAHAKRARHSISRIAK